MGYGVHSRAAHTRVHSTATRGGRAATATAERRMRETKELDPLVDPKGLPHLGPVRLSLPRFVQRDDGLWELTLGMPMPEETLLDCTGSMGDNVDVAMRVLLDVYEAYTDGKYPVLGRYDVQMATAVFGDVDDTVQSSWSDATPVLCRSQFEMGAKISEQMTLMVPGRNGCGNGKEDPQFGLFGAAFLTDARIWKYGLRGYHFTISDEPIERHIDGDWIQKLYGPKVFEILAKNGHDFSVRNMPSLEDMIRHLLSHTNAFFLQVNSRRDVTNQWQGLYGPEHCIMLPDGTSHLHQVKALIVGLTEGVVNLESAHDFLGEMGVDRGIAQRIVHAVSHIPLGAQTLAKNFHKIPVAGDLFANKEDLWPMTTDEIAAHTGEASEGDGSTPKGADQVEWL